MVGGSINFTPLTRDDIAPDRIDLVGSIRILCTETTKFARIGRTIIIDETIACAIDADQIVAFVVVAHTSDQCINANGVVSFDEGAGCRDVKTQVAADVFTTRLTSERLHS